MKMAGCKLRNNVNFEGNVKEKMNIISGCETRSMCVLTFIFTSFSEEDVIRI